ncbi:coiled-coil domain-containing protein [Brachionus plicatilis]|uniref:Coiled-coil domain-containing protein n=1 Tax=Brachionus plicatilis TaxID=10195 RepID=A0A3M7S1Z0_BRAPC|nr:coiled-coil domain-containing protein [Brachionus plicatilis]
MNEAKEYAESVDQSTTQKTVTTNTKKFSKNSRSSKLSKASIANRRAKTRDEMYAYYLTFGEHPNPDTYFTGRITNILREALEGILSNSEIYYRDLHQQNRQITRRASLKDSYPEFAEAIISKLKSYLNQCDVYRNQCLKEFRESVTKFEILSAQMPELVFNEIYVSNQSMIESDVTTLRQNSLEQLAQLDQERKVNDSTLRPALGHPNMQSKLDALNGVELKRQEKQSELSQTFIKELYSKIQLYSNKFIRELAKNNESLLIKFDDILTVDEVMKHETSAEKHATAELIKRHLAGVSLEDPEPEPLIRREKGKWKGVENYDFFKNEIESKKVAASLATSINTAKTTLPHKSCSQSAAFFHQKFKKTIEKYLRDAELFEGELKSKEIKWNSYWLSSIKEIKGLYN